MNQAFRILLAALALAVLGALVSRADDTDQTLDAVRAEYDSVQRTLDKADAGTNLGQLRARAQAAQASAAAAAAALAPQVDAVQARAKELGTAAPGVKEDADVAAQRSQLAKQSNQLDGQLKLAKLLAVEGDQLANRTRTQQRAQFQARLGERTASILSRSFWLDLADDLPYTRGRLQSLLDQIGRAAAKAPAWAWALAVLIVLAAPLAARWAALRLVDLIANRVPHGRLRRSLYALGHLLLWTATSGVIAFTLLGVLDWDDRLNGDTGALVDGIAGMLWFSGFLAGLVHVLVCAYRPTWRLLPLPDPVAMRLRRLPLLLAFVAFVTWLAERLAAVLDASLATAVAVNCIVALLLGLTLGLALVRAERRWHKLLREEAAAGNAVRRPVWLTIVASVAWLVLAGAVVCLLTGYVAFGSFAVKQVLWIAVLAGSAYLLGALIDDLCMGWIAPRAEAADEKAAEKAAEKQEAKAASGHGHARTPAAPPPAFAAKARQKAAVLLSAVLRVALLLVVAMLVLAPFGEGPGELLRRSTQWQQGLTVGEVNLRPGALLQALLVLLGGLLVVRLMRNWLTQRYLPTTALDPGMQTSAATLFGYAGAVVSVSLALSAMGIGLERVAWVASALSVGIGFGLQAVVQNFVSGLILLAERPVKVGDWVSLGGVEGDIRRINVRATEIQMGDRSTVIVPNSEFITKVVRNVTLADPLGLVQIKLPVPMSNDAEQVRLLMLETFQAHTDLVDAPAPNVQLDGVDGNNLIFNATGFVASPRLAYGARSTLLFAVLKRLRDAGIALGTQPTMLLQQAHTPEPPQPTLAPPISAAAPPPGDAR